MTDMAFASPQDINGHLIDAAKTRNVALLESCLDQGANPDHQNGVGRTALYYAAAADAPFMMAILIKAGASLNLSDEEGATPLHIAINNSAWDAATMLIDAKANIDYQVDADHVTPLQTAFFVDMKEKSTSRVEFLIEHGADMSKTLNRRGAAMNIRELARDFAAADPHGAVMQDAIERAFAQRLAIEAAQDSLAHQQRQEAKVMAAAETSSRIQDAARGHKQRLKLKL